MGAPFNVYVPGENMKTRAFAVKASDHLEATWALKDFDKETYHLQVYGPNGFYREFKGSAADPAIGVECIYEKSKLKPDKLNGNIQFVFTNTSNKPYQLLITDHVYKSAAVKKLLPAAGGNPLKIVVPMNLSAQHGWYDFSVTFLGVDGFEKRYAGKVETGEAGYSDPYMGRTV